MKHATATVILPSLSIAVLLLLALVHVYSEFGDDIAWETLKPDLSTNEGIERTNVLRTCNADDGTRKKGVVIVTTLSHEKIKEFSGVDNFYEKLWRNRKAFADLHGYELLFLDAHSFPISHSMHPVWSKFPAIQFAMTQFPSAEWIWWLDMDALIMTPWIDLRERLLFPDGMAKRLLNKTRVVANKRIKTVEGEETPELVVDETPDPCTISFLLTQDRNGLNAGSFLIRSTPQTQQFLDFYSDPLFLSHANKNWLLRDQDLFLYLILKHPSIGRTVGWINQTEINSYPGGWEKGELMVHFVSCGNDRTCPTLFNRFWELREGAELDEKVTSSPPKLSGVD